MNSSINNKSICKNENKNEAASKNNLPLVIFTTLLIEKSPQALPLGAACVASSVKNSELTKNLCNVKLISFCKEDEKLKKLFLNVDEAARFIADELIKLNPSVVGFSIFVWNRILLEKVSSILQAKNIKTIAGGPEVTANPTSFTNFDFVTSGEGEEKTPPIIYELLTGKNPQAKIQSSNKIENQIESKIESREQNQLESKIENSNKNHSAQKTKNSSCALENLSSPYLDGTLDPSEYEGALWELARGCPFKCSYCYESKGEKRVRQFPMERIEKELDLFAKKNIAQVFVLDPTYNANKKHAIELINKIAKKTPNTFYYFEARAEFIDRDLARAFTKIPCSLQIGLQSADENVLRLVNRPFNKKVFVKNIGILNETGVVFGLDVIYGLPGDTLQGFKNSVNFAISLYPNNLELFCLSVLPGTDLFDRAENLHLTFDKNPPYNIIQTDKFSKKDVFEASLIARACSLFYNDGRAVPWFNTICKALKMRASDFFFAFEKFLETKVEFSKNDFKNEEFENLCKNHKAIENLQIEFIQKIFAEKNLKNLIISATDIIIFNGALSRKIDTGVSETIFLNHPAEFIDSEYALDLHFFAKNAPNKKCKFRT